MKAAKLICFTSRRARNKRAHSLHGNSEGIVVRVSNVTSAVGKAVAIMQLAQDGLHLLSETKHDESISKRLHSEAKCFSSQGDARSAEFVLGAVSKGTCGVGLCAGPKVAGRCRLVPPPPDAEIWYRQGRLALFAVTVKGVPRHASDRGESTIYLFQLYGDVHSGTRSDELLQAVQDWSSTLGSVPIFICGDFNLEDSPTLKKWTDWHMFTDLHVHFARLYNKSVELTTVAGTRIDHAWANQYALRLVKSFDIETDHFATHHTCSFILDLQAFSQFGYVRHKPQTFVSNTANTVNDSVLDFIRAIKQPQWNSAKAKALNSGNTTDVRRQAVDELLDIWSERAERLLAEKNGMAWGKALHQRGKVQPLKKSYVTLPCTRNNTDVHESKDRIFRVQQLHGCQRRLRAVERMTFGAQRWRTWLNLFHDLQRIFNKAAFPFTLAPTPAMPDEALFKSLHSDLNALICQIQGAAARLARQRARDRLRTSAKYKYIRNTVLPPQHFVNIAAADEEPAFTCDISKIDGKITEYWQSIWQEPNSRDTHLEQLFLHSLPGGVNVEFSRISTHDVAAAISRAKGVGGADGWTAIELQAVSPVFDQLAEFYNVMEAAGVVPSTSLVGDISLIPKASGGISYKDMRPITVLGLLHRIYAAIRLRKTLFDWQEALLGDLPCMGCRKDGSTKDLTWPLCLQIERNLLEGNEMFGAAYDLAKAFDQLPLGRNGFLWDIMEQLQFPRAISTLMKDMYGNLVRRFKFNGFLGEPITSTGLRGAMQGCAFSMVAMNVAAIAWFSVVYRGCNVEALQMARPSVQQVLGNDMVWNDVRNALLLQGQDNVRQGGYADDLHVASPSMAGVTRAHWLTVLWAEALRMTLNASKSVALGNIRLKIGNQTLQCVKDAKILGDVINFRHEDFDGSLTMPDSRVNTCTARLARVSTLPGSKQDRLDAIAAAAIPVLFGGEFVSLPQEVGAKLRVRIWEAVRAGRGRPIRACMEVLMTIFSKGHAIDPIQFLDFRTMLSFARLAKLDQQARDDLTFLWNLQNMDDWNPDACYGPASKLRCILLSLQWQWPSPFQLKDPSGRVWNLPLNKNDKEAYAHRAREDLRQRELAKAVSAQRVGHRLKPRTDLQGVQEGVNFKQTRFLADFLPDYERGVLQNIVSGAVSTQEREARRRRDGLTSPVCPFSQHCSLAGTAETRQHRWWECPRWEHLRPEWFKQLRESLHGQPACFVQCAIATIAYDGPSIDKVQRVFLDIQMAVIAAEASNTNEQPPDPPAPPASSANPRRRLRGKQTVQFDPDPDPLKHPAECVIMEEDRLSCRRCGRNVTRSHATSVRQFWQSRCYANLGGVHLRAVARSVSLWNKVRQEHQGMVDQLSEEHGHPLQWAGEKYSSIRCLKCEWRAPLFDMIRQKKQHKTLAPICSGSMQQANVAFEKLKQWLAKYNSKPRNTEQKLAMHSWAVHPYSVFCLKCGIYLHKVPRGDAPHCKDNCGNLPDPWKRVHNDHLASGRTERQLRALLDGQFLQP